MFLQSVYKQNQPGTREEEAEILKQQGLMTIRLKYPFFTQQDKFAFLVKTATYSSYKCIITVTLRNFSLTT